MESESYLNMEVTETHCCDSALESRHKTLSYYKTKKKNGKKIRGQRMFVSYRML